MRIEIELDRVKGFASKTCLVKKKKKKKEKESIFLTFYLPLPVNDQS
jgi:hypothetical protein